MKEFSTWLLLACLLGMMASCTEKPKEPDPVRRKSPTAITSIQHGDTYIKVVYGQPYKNDREIFGNLVPYNSVWRTGANEATEMTVTNEILFGGNELKAGTYALFSIPGEESWTIILNSALGQWGAFDYDPGKDVLRVRAKPISKDQTSEVFTIQFDEVLEDSTSLNMKWDRTELRIPIEFIPSETTTP